MKWNRFRIRTTTQAEDIIISTLYEIGLEGAQIEDHVPLTAAEKEQMFVDIPPEPEEDDGTACLSFFLEQQEDGRVLLRGAAVTADEAAAQIRETLEGLRGFLDIGEGCVTVDETEDLDWINNWKQYFHSFSIDDLLVLPSWEEPEEKDRGRKVLRIDPGTAFGTGMHETTQLCIRQLKRYITPDTRLLDVGTGSGILSIVSLLYGIREAVGTDLDPCAAEAVRENLLANRIPEGKFRMLQGNLITDPAIRDAAGYGCYDIVVANILADVLVALTPVVTEQLKDGGIYITSGIIEGKEEGVIAAVEAAGMRVLEVGRQGEWRSVTAKKGGS